MFMIVPNYISDEIYAKIDALIAEHPDAAKDRELFYEQLPSYFNDRGTIPDFSLQRHAA